MRVDDVRKFMEAAAEKLTPGRAQELAKSMLEGQGKDQVAKLATELLDWSQRNRDRVKELVQREVRSQLKAFGVVTLDELDTVKKRVRDLERATRPAGRAGAAKSTAPRKPSARKPASKKTGAKA